MDIFKYVSASLHTIEVYHKQEHVFLFICMQQEFGNLLEMNKSSRIFDTG